MTYPQLLCIKENKLLVIKQLYLKYLKIFEVFIYKGYVTKLETISCNSNIV